MKNKDITLWLLRLGIAFVFLYAGISGLVHTNDWIGYLPNFLRRSTSASSLLHLFSVAEIILAIWLLSGKYTRYAALISAAMLAGITLSNTEIFIVTFRDVGLVFMALALAAASDKK